MSSSIISDATMKFGLETAPILSQGNADGKLGDKLKGDAYGKFSSLNFFL